VPAARFETIVLGAGLAGCALAFHLSRRGLGPTLLLDPRTVAGGATGRAAGIVTQQLWDPWDIEVSRESQAAYEQRGRTLGTAAYRRTGFLRWTHRAEFAPAIESAQRRFERNGVASRRVGARELRSLFPWAKFNEGAVGLYSEGDACVNPTDLAHSYLEEARGAGTRAEFGQPVPAPRRGQGGWEVELSRQSYYAPRLVIAAGAWAKSIGTALGHRFAIAPYRTQAALIRPPARPPENWPAAHDIDLDVYLRPEEAGRILVGDGTELREVDPERVVGGGTPEFLSHVGAALAERWPAWADSEVGSAWSGVCDATPDRRPLIGRIADPSELYLIAGFNGFGVMRAAGAARRLAALIAEGPGGRAGAELASVRPDRFGIEPPEFEPRPGFTLEDGPDPRC
jgi:sarcosine oxidase, subunit beta